MERHNIFVREYLESLKEDGELDRLLPILLRVMGFRIIRTPKEAKGQNQQGKDIVAEGTDNNGVKHRYFFEVKGHADKDITEASFSKPDGIADSLFSAIYVDYTDLGIPNFNNLPKKVVLVHNGFVKANATDLLNGFVRKHLKDPDNEFERWGIYELTDLFGKYLFSEYLLTDDRNLRLFKKTLAMIDQPEYDMRDYKMLVDNLLERKLREGSRSLAKMFSTLNLVSLIVWHYSAENDNLLPAIDGVAYTVLKTWEWVLKHNLVKKRAVVREFLKSVSLQRDLLKTYFDKTLPVAMLQDGLFSESGGPFEEVGYPLRAMDYVGWLVYYFELEQVGLGMDSGLEEAQLKDIQLHQKNILRAVIDHNVGAITPLLDRHSRPFTLVALFFLRSKVFLQSEAVWLRDYLIKIYNKIVHINSFKWRLPELNDNIAALLEYVASGERPDDYCDKSSMLLLLLVELMVVINDEPTYNDIRDDVNKMADLQTAYPNWEKPLETEMGLFEGNISNLTAVESSITLPEKMTDFRAAILKKPFHPIPYQTDAAGLFVLRTLSYIYFHNDVPPDEWRRYLDPPLQVYRG
jgi:hypothetical protein